MLVRFVQSLVNAAGILLIFLGITNEVERPSWRGESVTLERSMRVSYMLPSEVWKVIADLRRKAFGTPMFSQRPEAGYILIVFAESQ